MGHEFVLAVVSLIISITAFIVATAQALQQFAASAEGYRRCQEGIMGLWAAHTHRLFTLIEFRFKVIFFSPIIFVASPGNPYGPLGDEHKIFTIDGTEDSYKATHCRIKEPEPHRNRKTGLGRIGRVYTAVDELASWVTLLENLQKAEREGREWDWKQSQLSDSKPQKPVNSALVVQLQQRRREWDEMPDAVRKPFGTTTVSHIVEMATMLGMVWRTFDQDSWTLRAEGNGYMLLSQTVWGLGISVAFSVTGKANFGHHRAIPCEQLKELAFGTVKTIVPDLELHYEPMQKELHYERGPKDALWELYQTTQRTLRRLGCGRRDIERYFNRRNHIRSVNFELIAMLAPVSRLRGSHFRRLPNPNPDPWIRSLSAVTLMTAFQASLDETLKNSHQSSSDQTAWIQRTWQTDLKPLWTDSMLDAGGTVFRLEVLEVVHNTIDSIDKYLKEKMSHSAGCVQDIVGLHLRAVLEDLNLPEPSISFLATSECDTEGELLDHYFRVLLPRIIDLKQHPETATPTSQRQHFQQGGSGGGANSGNEQGQGQMQSAAPSSGTTSGTTAMQQLQRLRTGSTTTAGPGPGDPAAGATNVAPGATQARGHLRRGVSLAGFESRDLQDLWVTLMFRACCWWILHDFDETDVMVLPPRLKGSRLPVYIL